MRIYCFVPNCSAAGKNGMHRFPTNPERRQEWMKKTKTEHLHPTRNSKICRNHFKDADLLVDIDGTKRLAPNAVPSLLLPEPPGSSTLNLNRDHDYHSVTAPKKRRVKRLLKPKQLDIANVGNEIEVGAPSEEPEPEGEADLGPYITIQYLRSLEEKVLQQAKEKKEISRILRNTTKKLKRLQQKAKKSKLDDQKVLQYLRDKKKYTSSQLEFQEMQLRNALKKPHGRRYTLKEKSVCLALYKSGPRSYRFKENNLMLLPTLSTLGRHSARLMIRQGICNELFAFIKEKIKDWPETDKFCSFLFDEVSLKPRIERSTTDDEIIGFVELAGVRRSVFATHALTFMVRGINRPFKQALAFFYTHGLKSHELVELMILILETVLSTGLNVLMSVCDQVITNETAIHSLMDRDFRRTPGCLLKYKVGGKTIIHCYDAPHLIKVIRNNLQVKNLKHEINEEWNTPKSKVDGKSQTVGTLQTVGNLQTVDKSQIVRKSKPIGNSQIVNKSQVASWDYIRHLYELDRSGCHRLLPKITEEHVVPNKRKMKVCVATQVFSRTYGTVMMECAEKKQIPAKSCETAQVLLFFNDLFDSINGGGPAQPGSLKGSINQYSDHFAFWEWALAMLSTMSYINKSDGKINDRSTVINKFASTIRGYQEVTTMCLNNNIEEVSLRNTDSDGLENLFGCVKSCCQVACTMTPRQFRSGYTTVILNNLMYAKSESTNCEPDNCSPLLNDVHDLIVNHITSATVQLPNVDTNETYVDVIFDAELPKNELNFFEQKSLIQISNLIFSKIVDSSSCETCERNLYAHSESEDENNDISFRHPSSHFMKTFKVVYECIAEVIPSFASEKSLKKTIITEVKKKLEEEWETDVIDDLLETVEIEDHVKKRDIDDLAVLGCADHNTGVVKKLFDLTVIYALEEFCKNTNDLLTGKVQELPRNPTSIFNEPKFNKL